LDPTIYENLQKEKVTVGDVIYIEANSGSVKVQTSFISHNKKFNEEAQEFVKNLNCSQKL
jgi:RuvB-like protein 1 (pontin 52)